jgi:predicted TIM-barrel fold metal-dependent hydrolase
MDADGIDIQVVYPTRGISLSAAREVHLAVDIARAYNDWLADFCSVQPKRLKGVALVALQDVDAAVKEARRAIEELGFVGVMMPTNVLDQDIGHKQFLPFYEEVERLGVGLGSHGGIRASQRMHGRFGSFIAVHTLAFPLECMVALTGMIFAGVPAVFPKLRIAALEASCGWVPFLMDRMDEEFEKRGSREAPLLKAKPSEYLTSGQFYYAFELEESTLPYVAERVGSDKLLYSSVTPTGTPHGPTPSAVTSREDISKEQKKQFLWDNAQRFYGFTADAARTSQSG